MGSSTLALNLGITSAANRPSVAAFAREPLVAGTVQQFAQLFIAGGAWISAAGQHSPQAGGHFLAVLVVVEFVGQFPGAGAVLPVQQSLEGNHGRG